MIADILERARCDGLRLSVEGDRVRIAGPEDLVDDLLSKLQGHKSEVIDILTGTTAKEHYLALCRLLDEVVETRRGRGRLWQVFSQRAAVVFDENELVFMSPCDVFV